nr:hypothetical protein CFP56_26737 [Quercus suber]
MSQQALLPRSVLLTNPPCSKHHFCAIWLPKAHPSLFISIQTFPYTYSFWSCICIIFRPLHFTFGHLKRETQTLMVINLR